MSSYLVLAGVWFHIYAVDLGGLAKELQAAAKATTDWEKAVVADAIEGIKCSPVIREQVLPHLRLQKGTPWEELGSLRRSRTPWRCGRGEASSEMSYRSQQQQQNYKRMKGEDYMSYVTRIEKTTSMVEGPHFPNLHAIYKHKEVYKEEEEEEEEQRHVGRFGRAVHLERFDDGKGGATIKSA
ncbi:hypothetical protein BHE74_00047137 [Ensete ventricosum]|nr:hypothetical protein BHE74_00047137 [Ensete ventricosum]